MFHQNDDMTEELEDSIPYDEEEMDEGYDETYSEGYDETYDGDVEFDYDEFEKRMSDLGRTVVYMVVILVLSVACAVGMWFAADDVLALTKPDNSITITINEGDTLQDIAQNLKNHGLVNYKSLFVLYGKFSHAEDKISTGTFELNQMFDYHALVNGMAYANQTRDTVTLTFPEGYSCDQIFELLDYNGVCTVEELQDVAANHDFEMEILENLPYGDKNRLEGYLFPDTYDFYVDDEPVRVIKKLLNNFDSKLTEEMYTAMDALNQDIRSRMEEEGTFSEAEIENAMMDTYKVLTVASLIEKEAGADSERTTIASVIYNRLTTRVHPLLQIDATVEYALGEHKTQITQADLAVDSPYNTYQYEGLPPGPIANPGISSIMAALYPEDTEYFFYALNDTGKTHSFFNTYMEQQDFLNGTNMAGLDESGADTEEETTSSESSTAEGEEPYYQQPVTQDETEEPTHAQ